jgi:hypothetical protein
MSRRPLWLQLLIGWLPVWALFITLVLTAHPNIHALEASHIAFRSILAASALGWFVLRFTERFPWPHPFRFSFLAIHVLAAAAYSIGFLLLNSVIESVLSARLVIVIGIGFGPTFVVGVWLYAMVAGVSYAMRATERAALAEASAARSQLASLRSQLNPHFLFNALHTVVQLIPREPRRAAQAAEQLATLLRSTLEEDRDVVSVAEEWAFVERYLDLERIRFGERLRIHVDLSESARLALIPSFAVQTLVENAVRHGAAPRVEPTDVSIQGRMSDHTLMLTVRDTGNGSNGDRGSNGQSRGTGLERLRERLSALYGSGARLDLDRSHEGFTASLTIPQTAGE